MIKAIRKLFGAGARTASATPDVNLPQDGAAERPIRTDSSLPVTAVHVCIVSGERMGNVIPVLHEERPTHVVLLHTPEMVARAEQMQRFLQSRRLGGMAVTCTLRAFDGSSQAVIGQAMRGLRDWLQDRAPEAAWRINLTGGTTPMKIALFDTFRDSTGANASVIYSDTQRERIDNLITGAVVPYRDVMTLADYLGAQGLTEEFSMSTRARWQQTLVEVSQAVDFMLGIAVRRNERLLAKITETANLVYDAKKGPLRSADDRDRARLVLGDQQQDAKLAAYEREVFPLRARGLDDGEAVQPLVELGVLARSAEKPDTLMFPNVRAVHLLSGFWIEWYAARVALEVGFSADRFRHGLQFSWQEGRAPLTRDGSTVRNELDLCLVHRNRMLLIECKSRTSGKLTDAIYKLDLLRRRAGSALSAALLVSAAPLTAPEYKRVSEVGNMYFCAGPDLARLGEFLALWRDGRLGEWQPGPLSYKSPPAPRKSRGAPKEMPQAQRGDAGMHP